MSIQLWQCVAVAWNRTARGASKNKPSKTRKSHSVLGRAWYTDIPTYTIFLHVLA